ncbi:hypothetical protein D3C73_1587060 [compost metagenome]
MFFQRVTEHAESGHGDVAIADDVLETLGEFGEVLVHGLPEVGLDAFKAVRQDLFEIADRIGLVAADHGADADGFWVDGHKYFP